MIDDFFIPATRKTLNTSSKNDQYEYTKTYTETTINCYIGSRTALEQPQEYGKFTLKIQYKFYSDTICIYGDIIVYNGENFRIISKPQNTVNLNNHYKAYVEKIEGVN